MTLEGAAERSAHRIGLPRAKFGSVLILLLALVIALVAAGERVTSPHLRNLTSVFILLIAIPAATDDKRHRRTAFVLAILAALSNGGTLSGFRPLDLELGPLMSAAFAGHTTLLLLGRVIRSRRVTGDILAGAVAAYIMAGLTFAICYGVIEAKAPGAFAVPGGQAASFPDLVYFSFVTLFTVGFGDITPVFPGVRALVLLEGLFGIVFTTIVMASLVAAYLEEQRTRGNGGSA
jgi:hypothetical protein